VYIQDDCDAAFLRLIVVHWFCGLGRWDDKHIQLIALKHYEREGKSVSGLRKGVKDATPAFIGFVNIRLSEEEFSAIDEVCKGEKPPPLLEELLERLLNVGKLSLNYYRGSLNVTLTVLEGSQAGYAVSAFSDNLFEAVMIVCYKVDNYLDRFEALFKSGGQRTPRG